MSFILKQAGTETNFLVEANKGNGQKDLDSMTKTAFGRVHCLEECFGQKVFMAVGEEKVLESDCKDYLQGCRPQRRLQITL